MTEGGRRERSSYCPTVSIGVRKSTAQARVFNRPSAIHLAVTFILLGLYFVVVIQSAGPSDMTQRRSTSFAT
uniref:Uncharacterized protein n=1 Tax=Arundo donax TaxID=35708 RepID=A0A0A9B9J3_ARUDO